MTKRIVLCSDGTGNRAGKRNETNVFRLFRSLERHDADQPQVAFYDNGVGTEKFKLWRALGGAFGWGFAKNVKDLYTFLAHTYQPGDEIYLFGFSRGAATVRAFAGMLHHCGLLDVEGNHLDRQSAAGHIDDAFRAYAALKKDPAVAREFKSKFGVTDPVHGNEVPIKFIGVWDTVSALGFPKDLGVAVDLLEVVANRIWPHDFYDYDLNPMIANAYQALSLDDQRSTFRPMVWNETGFAGEVEQTWFPGVHSNVGGGYPRQGMADAALAWMMTKAADCDLRFRADDHHQAAEDADTTDKMYDPRAGLAVYYRYQPRHLRQLTPGDSTLRVHETVRTRMRFGTAGYAPGNLPQEFDIVDDAGQSQPQDDLNLTSYHATAVKSEPWTRRRQVQHSVFVYLSVAVAVTLLVIAFTDDLIPATFNRPTHEIITLLAGLAAATLLQWRKGWFWPHIQTVALIALGAFCVGPWSRGEASPIDWLLLKLVAGVQWLLPGFLESAVVVAIYQQAGITALIALTFLILWLLAEMFTSRCESIWEDARHKLLFENRPDTFDLKLWKRTRLQAAQKSG